MDSAAEAETVEDQEEGSAVVVVDEEATKSCPVALSFSRTRSAGVPHSSSSILSFACSVIPVPAHLIVCSPVHQCIPVEIVILRFTSLSRYVLEVRSFRVCRVCFSLWIAPPAALPGNRSLRDVKHSCLGTLNSQVQ